MAKKRDGFKVYSNDNIPRRNKKDEITVELEIPHEDMLMGLFVTSPYFMDTMMKPDYYYYPIDVEAEESLLVPILDSNVLQDFLSSTELYRKREKVSTGQLLRIPVEDEDGEDQMISLFDGYLQMEILKFFRTAVTIMNPDIAFEDEFEEIFDKLTDESVDNGYLDNVLNSLAEYLDDGEILEAVMFPEMEEE
ncbi:MAG: hypothetical protein LUF92_02025 [Clostridiales bacterium]|nr:hypothetical protein [Clostridiales bacterium]